MMKVHRRLTYVIFFISILKEYSYKPEKIEIERQRDEMQMVMNFGFE